MPFTLAPLPYEKNFLVPFMSEESLEYHYGKHHQAYVDNLNRFIKGSDWEMLPLEDIIVRSYNKPDVVGIFNNAAQNYNHIEFWKSMKKNVSMPSRVKTLLDQSFGSVQEFKELMVKNGGEIFGSGWVWLCVDSKGKLEIEKFANGVNPIATGQKEIFGCDVWEHSYYIDYRNRRPDYLKAWIENLINWEYVEQKLVAASVL